VRAVWRIRCQVCLCFSITKKIEDRDADFYYRLLWREDLECSGLSTMVEGPAGVQQEADNVYQLLDSNNQGVRKGEIDDRQKWGNTAAFIEVSYVRNGTKGILS